MKELHIQEVLMHKTSEIWSIITDKRPYKLNVLKEKRDGTIKSWSYTDGCQQRLDRDP